MCRLSGRAHVHSIGVLVQIIGTLAHIPHNIGVLAWIVWHTYQRRIISLTCIVC